MRDGKQCGKEFVNHRHIAFDYLLLSVTFREQVPHGRLCARDSSYTRISITHKDTLDPVL